MIDNEFFRRFEDKCQKLENQFSSDVLVEEDKAVKDIEEIKESHDKILADCKEEPTRQQLLHILEEHTKLQDQREQLKSLRQETIAMSEYFANKFEVLWTVETITYKGFSWEPESVGNSAGNTFPVDFLPISAGKSAGALDRLVQMNYQSRLGIMVAEAHRLLNFVCVSSYEAPHLLR
ncbi:hypothetical protein QL285_081864 [Trifolium repens]|nr:hypothetical protein QL285_081864 [Trifolium repens]